MVNYKSYWYIISTIKDFSFCHTLWLVSAKAFILTLRTTICFGVTII